MSRTRAENDRRSGIVGLLRTIAAAGGLLAMAAPLAGQPGDVFATVGERELSREEFDRAVYQAARQKYYHGRPHDEADFVAFRRSVAEQLVDRLLLVQEAHRRELRPDTSRVEARLAEYEQRYGDTERWQRHGPELLDTLRRRFEEDSLIAALEAELTDVGTPSNDDLRRYYEANPDRFTEPARNRLSIILLGVAPTAPPAAWQAADAEAERIVGRLRAGADFAELARLHSADVSARDGGDMGWLHEGMLAPAVEQAVAGIDVADVAGPLRVLEGVAIVKLTGRQPAEIRGYEQTKARAAELWLREAREARRATTLARLRESTGIELDTAYLEAPAR